MKTFFFFDGLADPLAKFQGRIMTDMHFVSKGYCVLCKRAHSAWVHGDLWLRVGGWDVLGSPALSAKWLRYRPEHDVKLLIKRWELCVVVQWRCSGWMERALVLIIGGQFSGDFSARELKKRFHVTVADAKEFFETIPGVLRLEISGGVFELKATNGVGWRRYGSRHLVAEFKKSQSIELTSDKLAVQLSRRSCARFSARIPPIP